MKLILISDTHSKEKALDGFMPEGDVLVHAGDLTMEGHDYEIKQVGEWLARLPYKKKLIIAGNHDFLFERNYEHAVNLLGHGSNGVWYLQNSGINIDGKTFYGMPQQPRFFNWAFNVDRGNAMREYTELIPERIDVLITHGPPRGIMDESWRVDYQYENGIPKKHTFKSHEGCDDLMDAINRIKPKLSVFGHFHSRYGYKYFNGTHFINASICDEKYEPTRKPFEFEL